MRVLAAGWVILSLSAGANATTLQDVLPGARAEGMGTAYAAVAEDPHGLLFNPAGPGGVKELEFGFSLRRLLGPPGPLTGVFAGYTRPVPVKPLNTVSLAGYGVRHKGVADKDVFLLSFAGGRKVRAIPKPVLWGASLRLVSHRTATQGLFGFGLDAGLLAEGPKGLRFGLSVTELMLKNLHLPTPIMNLGASYFVRDWILLAMDYRVVDGHATLYPGAELRPFSGLLRLRAGHGLSWDGTSQVALGFGMDFSPLFLDLGFTLPVAGLNEPVGSYQASVSYRFGSPPFYGRYVGKASEEASRLAAEVGKLEDRRGSLESQVTSIEANRTVLESQVRSVQTQLEELRGRLKQAGREAAEQGLAPAAESPRRDAPSVEKTPAPRTAPVPAPKPASWPRKHVVQEGDTLRSLSGSYYGDATLWELIYQANPDKVERGLPRVGAELVIPEPK